MDKPLKTQIEPVVLCSYLYHIWILVGSYSEPGLGKRSADSLTKKKLPILEKRVHAEKKASS